MLSILLVKVINREFRELILIVKFILKGFWFIKLYLFFIKYSESYIA